MRLSMARRIAGFPELINHFESLHQGSGAKGRKLYRKSKTENRKSGRGPSSAPMAMRFGGQALRRAYGRRSGGGSLPAASTYGESVSRHFFQSSSPGEASRTLPSLNRTLMDSPSPWLPSRSAQRISPGPVFAQPR